MDTGPNAAASILIVEDELIFARDLQATLSDLGYDVFAVASTAGEAIACAARRCPGIALMDIRIKGGRDGIEAADILRNQFDVPVVFLTAHSDESTLARAKQTEPFGYLIKPVNTAELRSVIEIALHRHSIEKRLRESERRHSTALHAISDAVLTVDAGGTVTFANSAAGSLIGLTTESMVGRQLGDLLRLPAPPADPEGPVPFESVLRSGQVIEIADLSAATMTVPRYILVDSAAPLLDRGRIVGAVMLLRAASGQRRLERQLEFSDRLVVLGTMAATAAHELNNALCVVTTDASYIAGELRKIRGDLNDPEAASRTTGRLDEIAEVLEEIQSAASQMETIVSDLRTRSRAPESIADVADLSRCVEWALRATLQEFAHRARVVQQLAATPLARGDETRIGQVIVNLLKNAAQSIAPGNVDRNAVTVVTRVDAEGRPVVEVSDTGAGIPLLVRDRIFEPFFTTKPVGIGTGLGLSVCQGIVNSIGGHIEVESELGKGTTFRVILALAGNAPGASLRSDTQAVDAPQRSLRILVVENEELVRNAVHRLLGDMGHSVTTVPAAADALLLIDAGAVFDTVFAELLLWPMTGMQFYEQLLDRHPDMARRVIFLTDGFADSHSVAFLESVTNTRLQKPFQRDTLLQCLQQFR